MNKQTPLHKALFCLMICLSALLANASDTAATGRKGVLRGKFTINGNKTDHGVVALIRKDGKPFIASPMKKTIIQEALKFSPVFSVVTPGSTVFFENRDDKIHNVRSRSPSNPFDIGTHLPTTVKGVVLKNKGAVSLECKVHVEMRALIYVSPSPFFAVTDKEGHFEIKDIPFGSYEIETWHVSLVPKEMADGRQSVEIGPKTKSVHLDFKAKAGGGQDMTNVAGQNWLSVVEEIRIALENALSRWQNKRTTSAAGKVMTTQSRLYRGSGFRNAIAKTLGESRSLDHEIRFDKIRKWVQGITPVPVVASNIEKEIVALVADLKKDASMIEGL